MVAQEMKIFKVLGNRTISRNWQLVCIDLYVFMQINYSVIGTCKVDINGMLIILVRHYERARLF